MGSARRRFRRLRRRLRPFRPVVLGLALIIAASGLWVAGRGFLAARDLRRVQADITALQAAATGDPAASAGLAPLTAVLQRDAGRAEATTSDPVWRLWQHAPVVGASLHLVGGVAAQSRTLAREVVPPLVEVAREVPSLRGRDGALNLLPLARQREALTRAARILADARARLRSYRDSWLPALHDGRARLLTELDRMQAKVDGVVTAAVAGPGMSGADGPRRYFVAVQNNAEARASGGIVSAYGVLLVSHGKASLERFGADTELRATQAPVLDLGPEWRRRYVRLGQAQDWREVTTTPDFPTAAKVMLALWSATNGGDRLDGVLSIDPLGLADVLQATGPVTTPTGRRLSAEGFAAFALSDIYRDHPDKADRAAVLTDAARTVFAALVGGAGSPSRLAERLGQAASGHHLQLYSAVGEEERALAGATVGGALPVTAAPLLGVITQDAGASKLSYYLRRQITYTGVLASEREDYGDGRGPLSQEVATVTVRLTNTAPAAGLPDYVTQRADAAEIGIDTATRPPGQMKVSLSVYLGHLGQLEDASQDGRTVAMSSETERGLSVFTTALTLDPGHSSTFVLHVRQPTHPGNRLEVLAQPVIVPDGIMVSQRDVRPSGALGQ